MLFKYYLLYYRTTQSRLIIKAWGRAFNSSVGRIRTANVNGERLLYSLICFLNMPSLKKYRERLTPGTAGVCVTIQA